VFGFGIGINVISYAHRLLAQANTEIQITNTLFLQSPPPVGFGFDPTTVSGIYATPVVSQI
jgi:hypothetical protein